MAEIASGVLKLSKNHLGVLRDPKRSYRPTSSREIVVPPRTVKALGLLEGVSLEGPVRRTKHGLEIARVDLICGLDPKEFRNRIPYLDLVATDPNERFRLAVSPA